jgi:hypothetical protein
MDMTRPFFGFASALQTGSTKRRSLGKRLADSNVFKCLLDGVRRCSCTKDGSGRKALSGPI